MKPTINTLECGNKGAVVVYQKEVSIIYYIVVFVSPAMYGRHIGIMTLSASSHFGL